MKLFILSVCLLVLGYLVYGRIVEKVFGASEIRKTPAIKYNDGIDYVPMPVWKIFLIQFLNIAGLGPVFGAVLGAVYGPACLLWIVFGSIFAGGVHDYLTGMFSLRYKGCTMDFLIEKVLNKRIKLLFSLFLIVILILVGAVFALNPAKMLADIFHSEYIIFAVIIFAYYFIATLLPVDKIIGKCYPFFAILLVTMTMALLASLFGMSGDWYHNMGFQNMYPDKTPIFPLMFITIACGAISGFHSTQSPIMARCITNEKDGRKIFYGAMIFEGFIALAWATLGIAFYDNSQSLLTAVQKLGQGGVVAEISRALLGPIGSKLTVLSVVILSITSGDTAFRSARLTIANLLKYNQTKMFNRLLLSLAVLVVGIAFIMVDITVLWMYFAWANQTLGMITLWAISVYLRRKNRFYPITLLPAIFMSMVCFTYILHVKIGFNLDLNYSKVIAASLTCLILSVFFGFKPKKAKIVKEVEKIS